MLEPDFLRAKFNSAQPFDAYLRSGSPEQQARWNAFHSQIRLTQAQQALLGGFSRNVNVLVLSGLWCGDCAQQCPFLAHFGAASKGLADVRFLDRDRNLDLAERVMICGGLRVPAAIFMNEAFDFISVLGDSTLSRLRAKAAVQLGAMCPLPGAPVPSEEVAATLQDWLDEMERVHLICRLSPKLRELHGD